MNKGGRIYYDPDILVKYKKPGHYYFRWQEGEFKGQEVIYVAGKNNDKLVAHSGGFFKFITLHLDPEGPVAMKRNHHPLTESGLEKIMKIIERDYNRFKKTGSGRIQLLGEEFINNRRVWMVFCEFPENRDFYAHRIILYFDRELNLPVKITAFDWKDSLFEEYYFRDLRINTGFEEKDFDPENPEYGY